MTLDKKVIMRTTNKRIVFTIMQHTTFRNILKTKFRWCNKHFRAVRQIVGLVPSIKNKWLESWRTKLAVNQILDVEDVVTLMRLNFEII